jgi:hypothetical protein
MKTITTLSLLLLLTGAETTETFWQSFKTAVSKRDVESIARLSKFPIGMSYGIPSIKTKAQLAKRYRQLFNEQTDAAACFDKAKPEVDPDKSETLQRRVSGRGRQRSGGLSLSADAHRLEVYWVR